jgi:hypothetical protein
MANILQAVLKPLKVASPMMPKVTKTPLSMPVVESLTTKLKVVASPRASLDTDKASGSKVYLITNAIKEG